MCNRYDILSHRNINAIVYNYFLEILYHCFSYLNTHTRTCTHIQTETIKLQNNNSTNFGSHLLCIYILWYLCKYVIRCNVYDDFCIFYIQNNNMSIQVYFSLFLCSHQIVYCNDFLFKTTVFYLLWSSLVWFSE